MQSMTSHKLTYQALSDLRYSGPPENFFRIPDNTSEMHLKAKSGNLTLTVTTFYEFL